MFVDVLPTFNCPEVMSYDTLVFYAVVTGLICLDRLSLRKKVIDSSEAIVSLLKQPELKSYLESFYYARYK
jgi:26S proteasome regulatory subunit N7